MKTNHPKIRDEMERRGMAAKDLSEATGMSLRSVYYILSEPRMSWRALEKLSAFFKIDPKDLLLS